MSNRSPQPGGEDRLEADVSVLLQELWKGSVLSEPDIERQARELLLDTLGSAISALQDPVIRQLFADLSKSEPGHLRFPGVDGLLSASMYLLGFSASVCHFEAGEGLPVSHGRPGLHAVPVLLAYGLPHGRSLREILEALVLAYEVGGRLGAVFRIKPGMHVDGTWGSFASATALARLDGLTWEQALAALNHVACQVPYSLYYPITMGSIARNFYIGHGAFLGTAAVRAAQTGFGGPTGSLAQFSRNALGIEPTGLLAEFPPERRILSAGYLKPYPCTRHMHYGIEAARNWFRSTGSAGEVPDRVTLRAYAEALKYCPNRSPSAHIQAQFSLSYGVAYTLLHGDFTPEAYSRESLEDPRLRELERRIVIEEDAELTRADRRGCTLEVSSAAGVHKIRIDRVPGDTGMEMTSAEVIRKFLDLSTPVLGSEKAGMIIENVIHGDLERGLTSLD